MEVHDLENENTSPNACQIDEIIEAGNAVVFDPDTLEQAHQDGYNNCAYCIGGSHQIETKIEDVEPPLHSHKPLFDTLPFPAKITPQLTMNEVGWR